MRPSIASANEQLDPQYTVINHVSSCFSRVPCGVPQPQGSTLGPLLFLLYVSDISRVLPGANVKLFADDTMQFVYFGCEC